MEYSNYDVYMMQVFHHLIVKENYQAIRVLQRTVDLWLMNPQQKQYPVVVITKADPIQLQQEEQLLRQAHRTVLDAIHREGKLLVLNVNENCQNFNGEFMDQIVIKPNTEEKNMIFSSKVGQGVHMVDRPQEEIARLTKEIEEYQQKQLKSWKKKRLQLKMQPATMVIIIVCTVCFLLLNIWNKYVQNSTVAIVTAGGFYKANVIFAHEYWRLLVSGFLHLDILHFFMNMYALFQIGSFCEKLYQKWQYVIILLVSIIMGNVFVLIGQGNTVGLGISGGIFGLLGAVIIVLLERGSLKNPIVKINLMQLITINLLISLMPGISMLAHLGGFVGGAFMGMIFISSTKWKDLKRNTAVAFTMMCVVLGYFIFQIKDVNPKDKELDARVVEVFQNTPLDFYADYLSQCYQSMYQ